MDPTAAVILAAGASVRLGMAKQLVRLGAETLLERTVRVAREAGLQPIIAVIPANLPIARIPAGVTHVVNQNAAEGMASSIRVGVSALSAFEGTISGAVVLACDQPAVTAAHLRALAKQADLVVASAYAGRKGIPAYFPKRNFDLLLGLQGDQGARAVLQQSTAIALPLGEVDIDTIEDLQQARQLFPP